MNVDDLPVLQATQPVARCGVCGAQMYLYEPCQSGRQASCPVNGPEWRKLEHEQSLKEHQAKCSSLTAGPET